MLSLQQELQQQREVESSLQTQMGLLRDTLNSKGAYMYMYVCVRILYMYMHMYMYVYIHVYIIIVSVKVCVCNQKVVQLYIVLHVYSDCLVIRVHVHIYYTDRELETLRMARSHQERALQQLKAQLSSRKEPTMQEDKQVSCPAFMLG